MYYSEIILIINLHALLTSTLEFAVNLTVSFLQRHQIASNGMSNCSKARGSGIGLAPHINNHAEIYATVCSNSHNTEHSYN